jgi:hypothetical protein
MYKHAEVIFPDNTKRAHWPGIVKAPVFTGFFLFGLLPGVRIPSEKQKNNPK